MQQRDLDYVIEAHRDRSVKPSKAFRKWDGKTSYHIHPIWCATMITTETSLPEEIREDGVQVLLYHDVLEDTHRNLPDWLSYRVKTLIGEMTFQGGSSQEMQEIWEKSPEVRLYKLYDKVSNLLDNSWMNYEKRRTYSDYTKRLCQDVEQNYGELNITKIARGVV
ncbi:MAG: hypothetical protein KKA62_04410 [Nanoarchaeota archaeon]|nr:hypothetical protein [Nanoarchaeota archaeon]MBU1977163.1 hypothetical protein [Nanoarchaeota archaeon]